jgi:hypothetical protein
MGMLAIANMILLLVGFLMRLRKPKPARIQPPQPELAIQPFTEAQKG